MQLVSPDALAAEVTQYMYERTLELSRAIGARLSKPRSAPVANCVRTVVRYAQQGDDNLSNDQVIAKINSLIHLLSVTCYPPSTLAARAIFDRKAGEPETKIEGILLAARARWDVELGLPVPIRWLAVLGGVSVKTARNLASIGQLATQTSTDGQMATAKESARWLGARGIKVAAGSRLGGSARKPANKLRVRVTAAG